MLNSNISDNELIDLVNGQQSSDALTMLISRHSGICHKIYHKYFHSNRSCMAEDTKEQKDSLIYQAVSTFDPKIGTKFSTWLGNVVTYACLNACGKKKREISVDSEVLEHLMDGYASEKDSFVTQDKELLDYIEKMIDISNDETCKEIIKMRYLSGNSKVKTFKEIATHFGVSTQTIVNWHDKFIDLLRKKLQSSSNLDTL